MRLDRKAVAGRRPSDLDFDDFLRRMLLLQSETAADPLPAAARLRHRLPLRSTAAFARRLRRISLPETTGKHFQAPRRLDDRISHRRGLRAGYRDSRC